MMQAVVFKGPRKVAVEQRPIPKVQEPGDVVVKVKYSGLCGSDLHYYRGLEDAGDNPDFIIGHELTGTIHEVGSAIKSLAVGERIVCPFTISCGECFYCELDLSSRCVKSRCFGTPVLDGAQAEYVRIPLAESTVFRAPDGIKDKNLILMADIFPTGYFAANNAFTRLPLSRISASTVVVIGCGPVGLCALVAAAAYTPAQIFAVDSVPSRLEQAAAMGAVPLNFKEVDVAQKVREATGGRGADVVLEIVGLSPALRLAFDAVRPFGIVSSVGVHNGEIPFAGAEAYDKNIQLQMGRCPVRSLFPQALEVLKEHEDKLDCLTAKLIPLSQAVEAYERFDRAEVQKFVFEIGQ